MGAQGAADRSQSTHPVFPRRPRLTASCVAMKCVLSLLVLSALARCTLAVDAEANHILVKSKEKIDELKAQLDKSTSVKADFEKLAKEHSTCPSGKKGGSLGKFGPGAMVKEFDEVVFKTGTVGKVSNPVKTQFGWHLLLITRRGDKKMAAEIFQLYCFVSKYFPCICQIHFYSLKK